MDIEFARARLHAIGWSVISGANSQLHLHEQVKQVAEQLGRLVPGRNQALVEEVIPRSGASAYSSSLSSKFGLRRLPLHTDTAYWPTPCRFLVLACSGEENPVTPTVLLDSRTAALSASELSACRSSPFLISNGRNSFYGCITAPNRPYLRVDPGCMLPMSPDAEMALALYSAAHNDHLLYRHHWQQGEILLIDNWRVLHGREDVRGAPNTRILLRATVI